MCQVGSALHEHVGSHVIRVGDLLGERRATFDHRGHQIRISDYNPYRIRQARASRLVKDDHRHVGGEEEGELRTGVQTRKRKRETEPSGAVAAESPKHERGMVPKRRVDGAAAPGHDGLQARMQSDLYGAGPASPSCGRLFG